MIATLFEVSKEVEVSKDEQNYNLACEHCSLVKKLLGEEEFCYCLVVLTRKVISFKVNERMYYKLIVKGISPLRIIIKP